MKGSRYPKKSDRGGGSTTNIPARPTTVPRSVLNEEIDEKPGLKDKSTTSPASPGPSEWLVEAVAPLESQQPAKVHEPRPGQETELKASVADANVETNTPHLDCHSKVFVGQIQHQDLHRSGNTGMDSHRTNEWTPRSDDDSMLERSEGSIFNDPEAPLECKNRHATGISFEGDQTKVITSSDYSIDYNPAILKCGVLAAFQTREAGLHRAVLKIEWDVLSFIKDQYRDNEYPNTALGSVITISGSVQHAQATTCAEYVKQNWASHGLKILEALQDALNSPEYTFKAKIDTSSFDQSMSGDSVLYSRYELEFDVSNDKVWVMIKSKNLDIIVSAVSQLAWMGTALRTSANGHVQYCEPKLEAVMMTTVAKPLVFNVTFVTSSPRDGDQSCWLPLFSNPVIARGFAIPEREHGEQGLEIPLEIMAALGGARHVTDFEGGLVLKGYSAMFVPIDRYDQSIQWHLIRRSDEQRVLYRDVSKECPSRAMLNMVDHTTLENTRAFLGWWKSAETYLGTADSAYDSIDWSPAGEARRSARIAGANLGFQNMLTGQLSFVPGAKDGRLHFFQKEPFQKIVQCAEKMPVALYDTADHRAWLVPGLDMMLHIVQTRHHLSPYQVGGKAVELTPAIPKKGRAAASEAIAANQQRQLYQRDIATQKIYYFQDAILDIWSQMERLMEKEDSIEACAGLALRGTIQDKLLGWEYMSLVHEKNYRRKEATIAKSSGGWADLINDIDCLVLFATGLHEVIKPVSDLSNLCHAWRTLPKGKDFLAAGVPMMELLFSEAGSRLSHEHLSASHLQWHRGAVLFEPCSGDTSHRCNCDRTQQIYHDSLFKTFGHVQLPGTLEADGCVIFGQAHHSFKPHKSIPRTQNPVYMLPNTPIEDCRINNQNITKLNRLSSTPLSISPEPKDINGYATQKAKRSPSPVRFTDELVHNNIATPQKGQKVPDIHHMGNSESDICERDESFPTRHHSLPKVETQPKRPEVSSTQTLYASEDDDESPHVPNNVHRRTKIGKCSDLYGCSCAACDSAYFEPRRNFDLFNNFDGTRRSSTSVTEIRGR